MDFPTHEIDSSVCLCCGELLHSYSLKTCCFFLLLFLVFIVAVSGLAALIIIFVVKPQQPIFTVEAMKLDSYKLDAYSESTLFLSSVVSLSLNAQNPNSIGIRYSHWRLQLLHGGVPIGVIRVPGFYQPAHSKNVSVAARVLLQCVNVSQLIEGVSLEDEDGSVNSIVDMRILGDIVAHVRLFRITLPKVKVALDCDINIDPRELTFRNELFTVKTIQNHITSFSSNSQTFLKRCTLAFYL